MSDAVMFIAWGKPLAGREERAVEVFGESVAYWGELQADGRIDRFDVVLLEPHGDLNGFAVLHGTHERFAELATDERWIRTELSAELVVESLCMVEGVSGDALAQRMALFGDAVSRVPARSA